MNNGQSPHNHLAPRLVLPVGYHSSWARLADGRPGGHQLVVRPVQGHELVVRSLLNHVASRHDGDDVRVLDGGQAVGDDDAGAALSGFVQRVLDRLAGEEKNKQTSESHTLRQEPWETLAIIAVS